MQFMLAKPGTRVKVHYIRSHPPNATSASPVVTCDPPEPGECRNTPDVLGYVDVRLDTGEFVDCHVSDLSLVQ